jgi:uncharacterized protein YyaL (SSP411 family)
LISLLKYLYFVNKHDRYIEYAKCSGDWLIRVAERYNGMIIIGIEGGNDIKQSQSFDMGIDCKGLVDLYELTQDRKYLLYAEKIASILMDAIREDGSVESTLYRSPEVKYEEGEWWQESGSLHSKIAMSLLQLYSINRNRKHLESAIKICEWTLMQQQADGSFRVNRYNNSVNLHAHCYTMEALLYAYVWLGKKEFLDAVVKAADWMVRMQAADGSLWLWYNGGVPGVWPAYAIAQFVRLLVLLHLIDPGKHFLEAATRASEYLTGMQNSLPDIKMNGGFFEFLSDEEQSKLKPSVLGSWSTMFAIQALDFLHKKEKINFRTSVMQLF